MKSGIALSFIPASTKGPTMSGNMDSVTRAQNVLREGSDLRPITSARSGVRGNNVAKLGWTGSARSDGDSLQARLNVGQLEDEETAVLVHKGQEMQGKAKFEKQLRPAL